MSANALMACQFPDHSATVHSVTGQAITDEIRTFDALAAAGTHGGLSSGEYRQFLDQSGVTNLRRTARIVELGCGDGALACLLGRLGFQRVTGIDISPGSIEVARQRAARDDQPVDFRVGDITSLTWIEAATVDAVLVSGVLHHFPTHASKCAVAGEVRRVLRPGGLFAGIEPNRWHPYWYLPLVMMKLTWSRLPFSFRYVLSHCTENEQNLLSPTELRRVLQSAGFTQQQFDAFRYIQPKGDETRYHEGAAGVYRDIMERAFWRLLPAPHNASYFVFRARADDVRNANPTSI